ncbi:hypothetical protein DFH08DRAFT_268026 [Mycena albidolilacea]|uniref:Uncharacterized protein n=1 Tax=Mycena albidolilacea TaxID=1033008 RepID=A0AAD7F416_9AGAR|nr:hypothetical protein DFH08DRAFT_268026 [Mycena albidolilacea]
MFFILDLVLSVPFNGILVRYRAASHPKASVKGGSVPPAPTFISMFKRVWRLQGVEGLSRGLMPAIVFTLFWLFGLPKLYLSPSPPLSRRVSLGSGVVSTLFYTILIVTVYRAITSPRKLDILHAREALHILFSAHERKKPWVILQIPGLLPALFINFGLYHGINQPVCTVIMPDYANYSSLEYATRSAGLVLLALLSTAICAPLEVITTRLALQRNYGGPAFVDDPTAPNNTESAAAIPVVRPAPVVSPPVAEVTASETQAQIETAVEPEPLSEKVDYPVEKSVETASAAQSVETVPATTPAATNGTDMERGQLTIDSDDVVVHLRSENEPYLGLVDCAKKIVAEEGWPVLYRMWFLTFWGSLTRL